MGEQVFKEGHDEAVLVENLHLQDKVHFGSQKYGYFLCVAGRELVCFVLDKQDRDHGFPSSCRVCLSASFAKHFRRQEKIVIG